MRNFHQLLIPNAFLFYRSQKAALLKLELAIVVDFAQPFVKATYQLEGSGLLAFKAYEIISALTVSVDMGHYPNLKPIIKSMCRGDPVSEKALNEYALQCIQPSIKYYKEHLQSSMQVHLLFLKLLDFFALQNYKKFNHRRVHLMS